MCDNDKPAINPVRITNGINLLFKYSHTPVSELQLFCNFHCERIDIMEQFSISNQANVNQNI
jgi:hypothetical protein